MAEIVEQSRWYAIGNVFGVVPSVLHEVLVDLFRTVPEMLRELLGDRLHGINSGQLRFETDDTTLSQLIELDADLVLKVLGPDGALQRALIVEVQLERKPGKARAWPAYQACIHRRFGCPTFLVVVTIDPLVAAWAAGPFDTGQTRFRPWVIGPAQVPVVTDPTRASAMVELTLLSGLAHRDEPEVVRVGEALLHALGDREPDLGDLYFDLLLRTINDAARRALTMKLENYRPQSEWGKKIFAKGWQEGEALGRREGEAQALLVLLEAREIALDATARRRVETCTDPDQLRAWLRRAATATRRDEIFGDT